MNVFNKLTTKWAESNNTIIMLLKEDVPIGVVCVDYRGANKKEATIWNLCVDERFRKHGFGHALLEEALRDVESYRCESVTLEWKAVDTDGWVLDWYKRKGFKVVGGHYGGCVLLQKRLWATCKQI